MGVAERVGVIPAPALAFFLLSTSHPSSPSPPPCAGFSTSSMGGCSGSSRCFSTLSYTTTDCIPPALLLPVLTSVLCRLQYKKHMDGCSEAGYWALRHTPPHPAPFRPPSCALHPLPLTSALCRLQYKEHGQVQRQQPVGHPHAHHKRALPLVPHRSAPHTAAALVECTARRCDVLGVVPLVKSGTVHAPVSRGRRGAQGEPGGQTKHWRCRSEGGLQDLGERCLKV